MGPRQLDLSQAPPIAVPLRFFLTAPLFAAGAALVALWYGGDVFASRFTPATLAIAHLLALGCLTMVMAGALMQIVPVLVASQGDELLLPSRKRPAEAGWAPGGRAPGQQV